MLLKLTKYRHSTDRNRLTMILPLFFIKSIRQQSVANMYFDKNRVAATERSTRYVDNDTDRMSFHNDDDKYGGTRNEIVRRVNDEKAARNNSNGKYHY